MRCQEQVRVRVSARGGISARYAHRNVSRSWVRVRMPRRFTTDLLKTPTETCAQAERLCQMRIPRPQASQLQATQSSRSRGPVESHHTVKVRAIIGPRNTKSDPSARVSMKCECVDDTCTPPCAASMCVALGQRTVLPQSAPAAPSADPSIQHCTYLPLHRPQDGHPRGEPRHS